MSIKPKTGRRLLLLGISAAMLAGAAGALIGVRQWQKNRDQTETRVEAFQLLEKGEYYDALGQFARYLKPQNRQEDAEAMRAYALCRERIEEPDGSQIRQAIDWYRKAWTVDRDPKTSIKLLDLYITANMNTEAREFAMRLRPERLGECREEHFDVLQREVAARVVLSPKDEINGQILRRMLELRPTDFASMVLLTEWSRVQGGREGAMAFVDSVAPNLSEGRAALLRATARRAEPGYDWAGETFKALCKVTGLDPVTAGPVSDVPLESPLEVLRLSTLFDSLNAFSHGLGVLTAGHRQFKDDAIDRALARRAWMTGRGNDIITLFPAPDLSPGGTHTEILIFRALTLMEQDKLDEARQIAEVLSKRKGDYRVVAWNSAFKALLTRPPVAPQERLALYEEAVKKSRFDPVLRVQLGDTLEELGRNAEARKHWDDATRSGLALGWMQPWLRRTYALLGEGRVPAAYDAATVAIRYSPRSMAAFVALFRAQTAMVRDGFPLPIPTETLLTQVDRTDKELAMDPSPDAARFREVVLPGRVLMTSRVRGASAAAAVLDEGLASMPNLSRDALSQLLDISSLERLNRSEQVLTRLDKLGGVSLDAIFPRAVTLLNQQKAGEGFELLERNAGNAPASERMMWDRAIARYLDLSGDAKASTRWAMLTDGQPEDLSLCLQALESPSVLRDSTLTQRLLVRAAKLGKYDPKNLPASLRLAEARSLLSEPVSGAKRAQAIEILGTISKAEPDWPEPLTLLIAAYVMDRPEQGIKPNLPEAIKEMRTLMSYSPDPAPLGIQLSRLYRATGDFASSKAELERVGSNATAEPIVRLEAADMLISQREMIAAETVLEQLQIDEESMRTPDVDVRLANVYRSIKSDTQALRVLQQLAESPLSTGEQVFITADGLASLGRMEAAQGVLDRLGSMKLDPGVAETVRARFISRHGNKADAVTLLRSARDANPKDEAAWVNLATLLIENRDIPAATAELDAAIARFPSSNPLRTLHEQAHSLAKGVSDDLNLAKIADILARDPAMKGREAAVRKMEQLREAGRLGDPEQVRALLAQYQGDEALMQLLAQSLVRLVSPPRPDLSAEVLRAGLRLHRTSIELAKLGTRVFGIVGAYGDMESAALQWRELNREPEADIAVAEAMVLGRRYINALEELTPMAESAAKDPASPLSVRTLSMYGRALCESGRATEAFEKINPLLDRSPALRTTFWLPAAGTMVPQEPAARAWIERVRPMLDKTSESDMLALASAYASLGMRFPQSKPTMLDLAHRTLASFATETNSQSPRVLESIGWIRQNQGRDAEAMAAYRDTLTKDPSSIFALRGLAQLSLTSSPEEAATYAKRAVELGGASDVESLGLLGNARLATSRLKADAKDKSGAVGDASEAVAAFQGILRQQPANVMAKLQLVAGLDAADRTKDTIPLLDELLKVPSAQLPPGVVPAMLLNNYADALLRSGAKGVELDRAFSYAQQASQQLPDAATFETLGQVELARGNRVDAIAAFRNAIVKNPAAYGAKIGLAGALIDAGGPENLQDARAHLDEVDRAGRLVPVTLQDQVQAMRRRLP